MPTACDVVLESAYAAYSAEVWRFAVWRSRDESVADDVVQDAFLRLHRELVAGRSPSDVRAWLCRVVANLIVSRNRHERVVRRFGSLLLSGATASTEEIVLRHDTDRALAAALLRLRPEEREVLLLAASGLRGPEIASRVGRSHAAVRALLCRARHHLREGVARTERPEQPDPREPLATTSCRPTPSPVSV